MSDIHRRVFESVQKGVDQRAPWQALRSELQEHLAVCPQCRLDIHLQEKLRQEAALRWEAVLEPQRPAEETLAAMTGALDQHRRRTRLLHPLRLAAWAALVILLLVGINWAIARVRPQPAVTPAPTGVQEMVPPTAEATPSPEAQVQFSKISLEPFAAGAALGGRGLWSLDSQLFFFGLVETGEDPLSDRRITTLNFLDPEGGEVCQQDWTILGPVSLDSLARWLPDRRLLLVTEDEGAQVLAPCGETLSLQDRFPEAIVGLPAPYGEGPAILLRGETRYWLLDPGDLSARPLGELPASREDRQAWSPAHDRLAIYQPAMGQILLLDAASGETAQVVGLPDVGEVAMIEWLLEDTLLIWTFSETGPALVDLASDEPAVTLVLLELFGLDLAYPNDFSSSTSSANTGTGTYHLAFMVNTPEDQTTYLYHSESGEVERLAEEGHTYLIFPNGDFEPLSQWEDGPTYRDLFTLAWVDDAGTSARTLRAEGHTPRRNPNLWPRLLPGGAQIAFSSLQGVSLVSIPEGEVLRFWSLKGAGEPVAPAVSPDGRFLVVPARAPDESSPGGLYYLIPLEP